MSVSLTPINDPDGESINLANAHWLMLTKLASPAVAEWNQHHDPIVYTPAELRAIARVVPKEWHQYNWAANLEWLATCGGAELS